ncbi:MAG: YraN family protein [Anaerolineae bacterium]|nr:YraN family protein [Anaerolineae bacterium]
MIIERQSLGRWGEVCAANYLVQQHGYRILARNWRCTEGEIDLVAQEGEVMVCVEVRTRRGLAALDRAAESLNQTKQRRLLRLVEIYAAEHDLEEHPWRVDVVLVALVGHEQAHIRLLRAPWLDA